MASFNHTGVQTNTKRVKAKNNKTVLLTYKTPIPQENESFYFNQEALQVNISIDNSQLVQKSINASIHITNKRLILISQTDLGSFDTFEMHLNLFKSLKSKLLFNKKLQIDIALVNHMELIKIELKFNNKQDAKRRESLGEYLKMATSAIMSMNHQLQQQRSLQGDSLPTYLEATQQQHPLDVPPAYS